MPSQTIHIPVEDYKYVVNTMEDTISSRAAELINKGIEVEKNE